MTKQILIGCEESGTITRAFRRAGYSAYSCDLQPTRGLYPEYHYQADVCDVVASQVWDLIILHPPCTHLAVSGNRWHAGTPQRQEAIDWTVGLWELALLQSPGVALENPVSVVFKHLPEAEIQYVQPWMFGHGEVKKTGFAVHNLPPLKATEVVAGREPRVWKMPPSSDRARERSVTYQGIADAIVQQWGSVL